MLTRCCIARCTCAPQLAKLRTQKEALEGLCRSLQAKLKATQGGEALGSESASEAAPEAAQVPDTTSLAPAPQQPGASVPQHLLEPVLVVPEPQPSGAEEGASAVGEGFAAAAPEPAAPTGSAGAQEGDVAQEGATTAQ